MKRQVLNKEWQSAFEVAFLAYHRCPDLVVQCHKAWWMFQGLDLATASRPEILLTGHIILYSHALNSSLKRIWMRGASFVPARLKASHLRCRAQDIDRVLVRLKW